MALATANNPTLREQAAIVNKAAGLHYQVGLKPNPTFGYQAVQLADQGTDQHTAFVEQEFVTASKLAMNRCVLSAAQRKERLQLETQRYRVANDVKRAFYTAFVFQQKIGLLSDLKDILKDAAAIAQRRLDAQEGTQLELLQANVQLQETELAFRNAQVAFRNSFAQLAALCGNSHLAPCSLVAQLPQSETIDASVLASSIVASSPEIRSAQADVARAKALLARHGVQATPNLTAQFAAGVDNATDSGLINLQLSAPIPVFNKNSGNITAARAEYCRAVAEVRRLSQVVRASVNQLAADYEQSSQSVETFQQEIIPTTKQALALAEQAYQAGESDFAQLLIARRQYIDASLQALDAQAQLASSKSLLDGFALTGGLDPLNDLPDDDSLRGLTFSQQ